MKNLYIVLFLYLSSLTFAQDDELFNQNWYLSYLNIGGTNYIPPFNSETPNVPLNIDMGIVYSIQTQVCNQGSGVISFVGPDTFTLDFFNTTLLMCSEPENLAFESIYFQQFFSSDPTNMYTYTIIPTGDLMTLTITLNGADVAVYTNETLSSSEFNKRHFNIYPNPVSDILNMQYPDASAENTTVDIYNSIGQNCISKPVANRSLDVSYLPSGIYFIKIKNGNHTAVNRFIKL